MYVGNMSRNVSRHLGISSLLGIQASSSPQTEERVLM
jgi:hypothetical protein